jgi:hypothetical protein
MQKSNISPCSGSRGFSLRVVLGAALLSALSLVPAHAANVSVSLNVDLGYPPATANKDACSVSVAEGANGLAVLDAAKAKGCISAYETVVFSGKHYVSSIDGIAQVADGLVTYWRMTVNGAYVCYGADDFVAAGGKGLEFAYAPGASFVLDPTC